MTADCFSSTVLGHVHHITLGQKQPCIWNPWLLFAIK